jgi:hypothetical protein
VSEHPDIEGTQDDSVPDSIPDAPGGAVDAVDVTEPASTASSPDVARALGELSGIGGLELVEHPDAYQRIHAELQSALASIDDA